MARYKDDCEQMGWDQEDRDNAESIRASCSGEEPDGPYEAEEPSSGPLNPRWLAYYAEQKRLYREEKARREMNVLKATCDDAGLPI